MNRKLLPLLVITFIALLSSTYSNAQAKIGGGLVYGSEIETIGININGQYFINDNLAIAPGFNYFFPRNIVADLDYKWFEFNANAHYYFDVSSESVEPYALGGLNFAFLTVDYYSGFFGSGDGVETETETYVGLNLGGGVNFNIDSSIQPFAELRLVLGEADQVVIGGGVRYTLN